MSRLHTETHSVSSIGWLRASVLGANDGIISTASLILGVASANPTDPHILVAGIAGLAAGALSMAAGEYVSVSSQVDVEQASLAQERQELVESPEQEAHELTQIYVHRGVELSLAQQLMQQDALGAHARDELGISETTMARPIQAAVASATTFSVGASVPLLLVVVAPPRHLLWIVGLGSLVLLALLGIVSAKASGSSLLKPTVRVTLWGAFAMALTTALGLLFGQGL
ncbi:MAG: VIT family protein [Vampirovibrionales bacterium]|nr:VIT family protein [Vampirovibrionales bacterium]